MDLEEICTTCIILVHTICTLNPLNLKKETVVATAFDTGQVGRGITGSVHFIKPIGRATNI
jgi:hypothetical protein